MPDETLDVCTGTIDCSVGYGPNDFDPHTANRLCFIRKPGYRCDIANLQAGYDLARSVDFEDAQNWIEEHYDALPKVKAMPSKDIAERLLRLPGADDQPLHFRVLVHIAGLLPLARGPNGAQEVVVSARRHSIFATYFLLLWGVFYFFQTLEAVVAVRFPDPGLWLHGRLDRKLPCHNWWHHPPAFRAPSTLAFRASLDH